MRKIKRSLALVLGALILSALLPATSLAQGWFIRPHRSHIVVYNYRPRPYVVYRSSPYYYRYGPETTYYNYGPETTYSTYGYGYYPNNYGYWHRPYRNHFRFGVFVR